MRNIARNKLNKMLAEQIKVLHQPQYYKKALKKLDSLLNLQARTEEEVDQIEVLTVLIEKYEEEHYMIDIPSAKAAIEFIMEQNNLAKKDLVPYFGSFARVSEFLHDKKSLTLKTIKALHERFRIPYEILMK
jgi:HTH-type transcriptional regulator/antitoxin HigA